MKRAVIIAVALALLVATAAAGYELAPTSPAACWLAPHTSTIHNRQRGPWRVEACIFVRVNASGAPVEQVELTGTRLFPPILAPIWPLSKAPPVEIFHYKQVTR